jgi:hypothetical protein
VAAVDLDRALRRARFPRPCFTPGGSRLMGESCQRTLQVGDGTLECCDIGLYLLKIPIHVQVAGGLLDDADLDAD